MSRAVFVGFRFVHSVVHLSYNKVLHRLVFFVGANVTLVTLWVYLLVQLSR